MTVLVDGQYEFTQDTSGETFLMGKGTSVRVIEWAGLLSQPEKKTRDHSLSAQHGGVFGGTDYYFPRVLQCVVALQDSDAEDVELLLERLHTVMDGDGVLRMKRRNKVQRKVSGRIRRAEFPADWSVQRGLARGAFEMHCMDPRVYEDDTETLGSALAVVGSGRTYPRVYPLTYGTSSNPDNMIFVNDGNIETLPIVRFYGPAINPQVLHIEQGKFIRFEINLSSTDVLEVDMRIRSAVLNGTSHQRAALTNDSRWWSLEPGTNTLRYLADSGSTSHVEVDCASAWKTG